MSTTWQCCAKRSTSATTQAAPGKTVPHCLKDRFVVTMVDRLDDELLAGYTPAECLAGMPE
jgi:hypothetical protein